MGQFHGNFKELLGRRIMGLCHCYHYQRILMSVKLVEILCNKSVTLSILCHHNLIMSEGLINNGLGNAFWLVITEIISFMSLRFMNKSKFDTNITTIDMYIFPVFCDHI